MTTRPRIEQVIRDVLTDATDLSLTSAEDRGTLATRITNHLIAEGNLATTYIVLDDTRKTSTTRHVFDCLPADDTHPHVLCVKDLLFTGPNLDAVLRLIDALEKP